MFCRAAGIAFTWMPKSSRRSGSALPRLSLPLPILPLNPGTLAATKGRLRVEKMSSRAKPRYEFWTPEYWRAYCESDNPYRRYKFERDSVLAIELLQPHDGERILEVGCGYGRISRSLVDAAKIKLQGVEDRKSVV